MMKMTIRAFLFLGLVTASFPAFADGFRCVGDNFKVQFYNHTDPRNGTKNPAALIVYARKNLGTIASLHGEQIHKKVRAQKVRFEGIDNHDLNGRFIAIRFEVNKKRAEEGPYKGLHAATLALTQDKNTATEVVYCKRYLKNAKN